MLQPEASTEMAQLIPNAEAVETETNTTQQDDGWRTLRSQGYRLVWTLQVIATTLLSMSNLKGEEN